MRSYLVPLVSAVLLAIWVQPAQAFWGRNSNLPVPGRMDGQPYNPAAWSSGHPAQVFHLQNHYPTMAFSAMPGCGPSEPPAPPFRQPMSNQPVYIPSAPDLMNPGPYGVLPPFQPFQGMLLPPRASGVPMMGGGGGGGPGTFGFNPFVRSPRDFFMSGF